TSQTTPAIQNITDNPSHPKHHRQPQSIDGNDNHKYGDVAVLRLYKNPRYNLKHLIMTQPKFKGKYRIESTRLPDRDYAANGWYFVTICTKDCIYHLGNGVISGKVQVTPIGEIAQQFFAEIPKYSKYTYVDAYVVMPNHVHGIVVIDKPTNIAISPRKNEITQTEFMSQISPKSGSLSTIIRSYKSAVTRWCRRNQHEYFAWQERFYESIIRADDSIDRIRQYIINNPAKWEQNKNNPPDLWM
ncbi:MAG: transposase, partial [Rivularia sp. (in: cyanobacteria)]